MKLVVLNEDSFNQSLKLSKEVKLKRKRKLNLVLKFLESAKKS